MSADLSLMGHRVLSPKSSGHTIGGGAADMYRHDRNYVDCLGPTDGFVK